MTVKARIKYDKRPSLIIKYENMHSYVSKGAGLNVGSITDQMRPPHHAHGTYQLQSFLVQKVFHSPNAAYNQVTATFKALTHSFV
jgi:hypothetical protein